jgi:hypothetical protein
VPDQEGLLTLTEAEAKDVIASLDRLEAEDLIGQYTFDLWEVPEPPMEWALRPFQNMLVSDLDDPQVVKDFYAVWSGVRKEGTNVAKIVVGNA